MENIAGVAGVVLGALVVLATVLAWVRVDWWWIRVLDFPRAQLLALAAVALALAVAAPVGPRALRIGLPAAVAACALFQLYRILPYTPLWRRQVQRATRDGDAALRLLIVNVLMDNRDAAALLAVVRDADPDIVLACETDEWWAERLAELAPALPHVVSCPLGNTYGMVLRSRLELVDPELRFLVQHDIPSIHTRVRLRSGDLVSLHGVHPRPPAPQENDRSTERDAELLLVGEAVKDSALPVIVAGDLNDVAWSRTTRLFQRVSGLLDPRVGRGLLSSFHAEHALLRWPLDHIFHSKHFRLLELRRLRPVGSDHFPVLVALALEGDAPREQEEPRADSGDHREAHEKIAEGREGNG